MSAMGIYRQLVFFLVLLKGLLGSFREVKEIVSVV